MSDETNPTPQPSPTASEAKTAGAGSATGTPPPRSTFGFAPHFLDIDARTTAYPAAGDEYRIDGRPLVLVPDNCKLQDLEDKCETPARVRAKVSVREVESFTRYVKHHCAPGRTVFAERTPFRATCIIDYPENYNEPRWGDHRCILSVEHSAEWNEWMKHHRQNITQAQFAAFIEDRQGHFVKPGGADMLTIAKELKATKTVTWKGIVDEANGDIRLDYANTTKAGSGNIELTPGFTIGIPVFEGGEKYNIGCRLRADLSSDQLVLRYELLNVAELLRVVTDDMIGEIKTETGLVPFMGTAPDRL